MKNQKPKSGQKIRTPHEQLAREVAAWEGGELTPARFVDAPEAVPKASRSVAISMRMPHQLLELVKRFAEREGVGYQVLIKRWLDERLRAELDKIRQEKQSRAKGRAWQVLQYEKGRAPGFPLMDRADPNGSHYVPGEY